MNKAQYFVVPAPGHYGDKARVLSSHSTAAAAKKAAKQGLIARVGAKRKGDEWLRSSEDIYPAVA
jgi:hypothetical protein